MRIAVNMIILVGKRGTPIRRCILAGPEAMTDHTMLYHQLYPPKAWPLTWGHLDYLPWELLWIQAVIGMQWAVIRTREGRVATPTCPKTGCREQMTYRQSTQGANWECCQFALPCWPTPPHQTMLFTENMELTEEWYNIPTEVMVLNSAPKMKPEKMTEIMMDILRTRGVMIFQFRHEIIFEIQERLSMMAYQKWYVAHTTRRTDREIDSESSDTPSSHALGTIRGLRDGATPVMEADEAWSEAEKTLMDEVCGCLDMGCSTETISGILSTLPEDQFTLRVYDAIHRRVQARQGLQRIRDLERIEEIKRLEEIMNKSSRKSGDEVYQ